MNEDPSNPSAQTVPTLEDWHSEPWDLDVAYAFKNFNGKAVEESVLLFEEHSIHYQEDLMWMPSRVFGYYCRAYVAYLLSAASSGDADGANCFIGLIENKLQTRPADVRPVWPEIRHALEYLAANQPFFDASPEIYGSFQKRAETLGAKIAAQEAATGDA